MTKDPSELECGTVFKPSCPEHFNVKKWPAEDTNQQSVD